LHCANGKRKNNDAAMFFFVFSHHLHCLYYLYLQVIPFAMLSHGHANAKYAG
jgi:hypothetical protein